MPTSQEMHRIVAAGPMIQASLFLLLDALTHVHLLGARRVFLGKRKYDWNYRWAGEPYVEDDFSTSGNVGLVGFLRALIKALEAQGRGFAHGHEKTHSEPITKAIDLAFGCNYKRALLSFSVCSCKLRGSGLLQMSTSLGALQGAQRYYGGLQGAVKPLGALQGA